MNPSQSNTGTAQRKRESVSYSQVAMFMRCPKQWEHRYVMGLKRPPPGVDAAIGIATHKSAEMNLAAKMQGQPLAPEDAVQAARDELSRVWEGDAARDIDPVRLEAEDKLRGVSIVQGEAVDLTVKLARVHHAKVAPAIRNPIAVEQPFRFAVADLPKDVIGYIDVVESIGEKGRAIRDLKTRSRKPSEGAEHSDLQLSVYGLSVLAAEGTIPEVFVIDTLVKRAKGDPDVFSTPTKRTREQLQITLDRLRLTVAAMDSGLYPPTTPDNWCCSESWCGYWDVCPFGKRQSSAAR